MLKRVLFIFSIVYYSSVFGQFNFQKTFLFNDTVAMIQNVYATDSCYYFSATTGKHPDRFDLLFGKLRLNGTLESYNQIQTSDIDLAYYSRAELDTNYRGNFIAGYNGSPAIGLNFPKFVEMDQTGSVVDSFYITQFQNAGITLGCQQIITSNEDSTYIAFCKYYLGNSNGVILFKFNQAGDTIWSKKVNSNMSLNNLDSYNPLKMTTIENGILLFSVVEYRDAGPANDPLTWAKIHFYKIDMNGVLINHHLFQDSPVCYGGYSLLPLDDGTLMHTYLESAIIDVYGQPEIQFRPVISKLDSNFHQIWKDTLRTQYFNLWEYSSPSKLVYTNNNSIVGAYEWLKSSMYDTLIWNSMWSAPSVCLFNYSLDGKLLWNRKYNYFQLTDSVNEPDYTIQDIEITADSGYIITGFVENYDSLNAQLPGQLGYILKTNCLGFLGAPEAHCSYQLQEGLLIDFFNSSFQAGSFEWHFGDGSPIVWSSENNQIVSHNYSDFGPFTVTLIAHGCNGEADTMAFTVSPAIHLDPTIVTDGQGYFAIFPNPLISGNKLIVYLNGIDPSLGNVKLELYDENAKLVQIYPIGYEEGSYLIESNVSSGMYHINLIQGDKLLQSRKLVVQ